uniref:Uncharacterized protein n=1 Tax=Lactuca sativa TaxID=4236 RepID=A0A9R1VBI7_LACSA|nr:hypothetical protein LSAT_V11C500261300 [Lactuca sativa]
MSVFFQNAFAIDSTMEFNAILDHGQASPAQTFICEDNSVSFLAHVIQPIYNTLSKNETIMGKLPIQHGGIMMISMNISGRSFIFVTNYSYFIYFSEAYT